jgi:2-(1,2-epoxy-1,2-dihydrophenyl)acetyl-CoA isomerase
MPKTPDGLLIEESQHLLRIRIDRAERRNAITGAMMHGLREAFEVAATSEDIRVVLIEGAGEHFSAGGDIKDIAPIMSQTPAERSAHFTQVVTTDSVPMIAAMDRIAQPIVVACRGHVIGAAVEMAAVADLVVASETARFTIPQVDLAHTIDHGESYHLPRKIGLAKALQMCLLAERIGGAEAERIGLANWVVPDGELEAKTDAVVDRLLASPPIAIRGMKSLLRDSRGGNLAEQARREVEMIGRAVATEDFTEAIAAFAEKRKPVFQGR